MAKRRRKKKMEFSKKLMLGLTIFNMSLIIWGFILYTLDKEIPAEIIVSLITGLFGEFGSYLFKAFKAKDKEEQTKLYREEHGLGLEDDE